MFDLCNEIEKSFAIRSSIGKGSCRCYVSQPFKIRIRKWEPLVLIERDSRSVNVIIGKSD